MIMIKSIRDHPSHAAQLKKLELFLSGGRACAKLMVSQRTWVESCSSLHFSQGPFASS